MTFVETHNCASLLHLFQPKQSSRVRRQTQIRFINYFIIPPVSRDDGALHIFFYRPSCLDTVPKIIANTRRTIVRLYKSLNTRGNTKIIESRNVFFDKTINVKPQFCMTCVETHNCASLLHLFQPKKSSRVRRGTQIRIINYFIMPPVSRADGTILYIFYRPSCLDTVLKIIANTRRTIVRLYRGQNTR